MKPSNVVDHAKTNLGDIFGLKSDRSVIIKEIARELVKTDGQLSEILETCIIVANNSAELALLVHYYHVYSLISLRSKNKK